MVRAPTVFVSLATLYLPFKSLLRLKLAGLACRQRRHRFLSSRESFHNALFRFLHGVVKLRHYGESASACRFSHCSLSRVLSCSPGSVRTTLPRSVQSLLDVGLFLRLLLFAGCQLLVIQQVVGLPCCAARGPFRHIQSF